MKFHPAVSILFSLVLFVSANGAEPTPSNIGHWHFSLGGLSTGALYLKPDGHFRRVMQRTGDAKPFADQTGNYKLVDGVLELYFDPATPKPVKYRYLLQDNDTFIIMDMKGGEKMPYKRVPDKSPSEAAKTYYETYNKGVQADIEKLMSASNLAAERALPPERIQDRKAGWDFATKNGSVIRVEIIKENIQGTRAWVDVRLHYKDGTFRNYNCGFTIEGGEWKTTID